MVYPKVIQFITTKHEYEESPNKLIGLWNLLNHIDEIDDIYLTVIGNTTPINYPDNPYLTTYVKDNGLEELTTKEYAKLTPPDLIIKTGAPRLTNSLLWHTTYSEYYFTEKPLKKLNVNKLDKIMRNFQSHHRTYGM